MSSIKGKIGTHNGAFHSDEALACFLVKLLPQFKDWEIIRSRDPVVLETCDMVIDVGGVYCYSSLRFDHHQKEFKETFSESFLTKLSSAGLIYKHFGKDIIRQFLHEKNTVLDEKTMDFLYVRLYKNLIEEFDAHDNGISAYPPELKPAYVFGSTSIFSRVSHLNTPWNEPEGMEDQKFLLAVSIVGEVFQSQLNYMLFTWLPCRNIVENAFNARFLTHSSGAVICLETSCPWKEHLFQIECENNSLNDILYVLYFSNDTWRVGCVPVEPKSFKSRKALPESWRGLRDETLVQVNSIADSVFTHATGFIAANKTKEGALAMAVAALNHS